ncbi:MAG: cyanophycin synthetase, partial [Planctomycetota bacterium]
TPDALENVLRALRPLVPDGHRLIVVFGCGGDRDRTKRPLMAKAACGLANHAVLTSDNPRTEDPQQILDDALAGADDAVEVEIDRAAAIRAAVHAAAPGDTVLIAGKGHEDYQILGTEKIHFDDREQAAAALRDYDPTRAGA